MPSLLCERCDIVCVYHSGKTQAFCPVTPTIWSRLQNPSSAQSRMNSDLQAQTHCIHIMEKCTAHSVGVSVCYLQYWCRPRRCTAGMMRAPPLSCADWPSGGLLCRAPTGSWYSHSDQSETHKYIHTKKRKEKEITFISFVTVFDVYRRETIMGNTIIHWHDRF